VGAAFSGRHSMQKRKAPTAANAPRAGIAWRTVACLAVCIAAAHPAAAFELITASEAALPPGTAPAFEVRGSPTRLPSVTVLSPPPGGGAVYAPLDFKLRFRAFGGAAIDPDSVVVTYIKQPDLDITPRIKAFITANGIDIAQAEVPPGVHQFWVRLRDTDGRVGDREFDFRVVK
jgi:hypothetical protein